MTVIQHMAAYLQRFPRLAEERIDLDCLATEEGSFCLYSEPTETVIRRYLDGSSVRRKLFTFAGRRFYGTDLAVQAENAAIFEDLENWLLRQEQFSILPDLGDNRRARELTVFSSGAPVYVDEDGTAQYQMQLQLIYLQEVTL